jgi:hypothetical protein
MASAVYLGPPLIALGLTDPAPPSPRKRMLYDRELPDEGPMGNRVMVYSTLASDPQPFTSWEAGVDAGQQWREARLNTSVVVRVMRYDNASAVVRLCRAEGEAEGACGDGLDNDCDGRVDGDDPDCATPQGGWGRGSAGGGSGDTATTTAYFDRRRTS